MQLDEFRDTLETDHLPHGLAAPLRALWHDARGDWKRAHEIVQAERGKDAERVHAYLHRKEGDLANADYWYARARAERPRESLDREWEDLVQQLLREAE